MSGRRHVSMPQSSGSRIQCPSATLQGKAIASLHSHNPRQKHARHHRGNTPKRKDVRIRKHLVMCAVKGSKFEFWKPQQVPDLTRHSADEDEAPVREPHSLYRGTIQLTAASRVEVDRLGYELKVHIVHLSADKTDAVTDTYTFLQAPDHMEPRVHLNRIKDMLVEHIVAMRGASGRMVEFNSDPAKRGHRSVVSAPPLWEGPMQPAGYNDANLLDGYIPHFLAEDTGLARQMQPETALIAAHFEKRKHQLWTALHQLKGSAVGSKEGVSAVADLLRRQHDDTKPPSAVSLTAIAAGDMMGNTSAPAATALDMPQTPMDFQQGGGVSEEEPIVSEPALDFSKYRQHGDSSKVWDVEYKSGVLAMRHTHMGITVVVSTTSPQLSCAIVSAGGNEYIYSEELGLQERVLSESEREVVLAFANRFVTGAASQVDAGVTVALDGGWQVKHDWDIVLTKGMWALLARTDSRCVALNAADPGGGIHLLANGFVFLGRSKALLHLFTDQGPVGPVIIPHAQAVAAFTDEEEERPDAAHNLCAWRPLAQLNTTDIQLLRQEKAVLTTHHSMQPINLTVAGQPPFEWTVAPRLPPGLDIMLVDDHSAQILGVPQSEEHSVEYAVCARNRLGSSVTHVSMSVMTQPGMLAYPTNLLQLTPGVPVRLQVGTLEGSRPINFKCDQLLPQGVLCCLVSYARIPSNNNYHPIWSSDAAQSR